MNQSNVVKFPGKRKGWTTWPAIYTFAFSTLLGPAIAAAIIGIICLGAGAVGKGPPSLLEAAKAGGLMPYTAGTVLDAYVWSAIPAALAGLVMAALVYRTGNFHWLYGSIAAAVAASMMAVISGGQATNHVSFIAAIAAVTAVLGRMVLAKAGVVEPATPK